MTTIKMSEDINHHRRRFLGTAAMTIAGAQLVMTGSGGAHNPATQDRQLCPRSSRGRTRRSAR